MKLFKLLYNMFLSSLLVFLTFHTLDSRAIKLNFLEVVVVFLVYMLLCGTYIEASDAANKISAEKNS